MDSGQPLRGFRNDGGVYHNLHGKLSEVPLRDQTQMAAGVSGNNAR
jgi:hypothetical protein